MPPEGPSSEDLALLEGGKDEAKKPEDSIEIFEIDGVE